MPGLVPGIHVFPASIKTWMAGTSPAMTDHEASTNVSYVMPALGAGIHVFLAGDVYRTNSRIALSRPSSVSGYIRPPMS